MIKYLTLAVLSVIFLGGNAFAGEPTVQLKKNLSAIQSILNNKDSRRSGRFKDDVVGQLHKELDKFFSWEEMARRAVRYKSKAWLAVPKKVRDEYIDALKTLLEETYIGRLDEYSGQSFDFPEGGERIKSKGRKAEVKSFFKMGNEKVPVIYKMFLKKGVWWVYDVDVEGVGMIMNYRTQFESILQKGGIPEVTKRLKEKVVRIKAKKEKK